MPTWSRSRVETILLAVLAIVALIPLRFPVEPRGWFLSEMGSLCLATIAAITCNALIHRFSIAELLSRIAAAALAITPLVFAFVARQFGSPIPFEMSALTLFGAASLAIAVAATSARVRSMSLVASGFLVLFAASISDDRYAVALPLIWMLGCVWHLVANHWERLDLAMPDSVQRNWTLRPSVMIASLLVLVAGGYAAKDRVAASKRLQFGFMPTSGGHSWSDPAARSGVGSGDAAIAAKDHAESFGAVDSDIFLESTESTLFDMVNDMIGEPKVTKTYEQRQAMANENVIQMHERAAKSEQGGGTFATERMPPKKHRHFDDARDPSVVQWDGPTGIRLAMQRYDTFDGQDWSQSTDLGNDRLTRVDIGEAVWFFEPMMRRFVKQDPDATSIGLLKIIRLDSPRFPVPMLTAGIHIKKINRQDFFGVTDDGSFFMPGRKKVPALTVVHVASTTLMEDEIRDSLRPTQSDVASRVVTLPEQSDLDRLAGYVADWTTDDEHPHDQLKSIVSHLRTEFTFDRAGESSASSIAEFLQTRRGGDHLFATTAALMARRIGLPSRLVSGFYVRPDSHDFTAGHADVLPQDVHVWAEVQLGDGRWFEIEPTPGYVQPHYQPSFSLLARRFAAAYWPIIGGGSIAIAVVWVTRASWIDWLLTVVWGLTRWLRPRRRIGLAMRIIEARARLAGQGRPVGTSQRAWLEHLTRADAKIANVAEQFSDAADAVFFGDRMHPATGQATGLVDLLGVRKIIDLTKPPLHTEAKS